MKKKVKIYYAKVENMGDILNVDVIKKCFDLDCQRHTYLTGSMAAIGSGLGNYTYDDNIFKNILKYISSIFFPTVYIWGTGFIEYKKAVERFYKSDMHFNAVRGNLSKKRVEDILGRKIDAVTGDAGILASYLLDDAVEKKYDVGIIAHYKEQDEPIFNELLNKYDNALFIDVRKSPYEVTKMIGQCRFVISSSLHGLIIADSLRVPNIHLVVSDKLLGDGYKFDDYYSAYNLDHYFVNVDEIKKMSLQQMYESYRINDEMVDKMKRDMLNSFPFKEK